VLQITSLVSYLNQRLSAK